MGICLGLGQEVNINTNKNEGSNIFWIL